MKKFCVRQRRFGRTGRRPNGGPGELQGGLDGLRQPTACPISRGSTGSSTRTGSVGCEPRTVVAIALDALADLRYAAAEPSPTEEELQAARDAAVAAVKQALAEMED